MADIQKYATLLTNPHIYTAKSRKYFFFGVFAVVITFLLVGMILSTRKSASLIGIGLIAYILVIGTLLWLLFSKVRLIVAQEGVVYIGAGRKLYTPWENVGNIFHMPRLGDALQLRDAPQPMSIEQGIREHRAAVEVSGKWKMPLGSFSRYNTSYMIPLQYFVNYWQHNALGKDIEQYAPQVFNGNAEPAKTEAAQRL